MALFFMAASDRNLANTIRSALIAQAKETGGLLYNDFKEARNSYNMASRIGRSASRSVVVGFVDPQSDERAREITGKFAFDASVTCEQIQSQVMLSRPSMSLNFSTPSLTHSWVSGGRIICCDRPISRPAY